MKEENKKIGEYEVLKASVDYANNYFDMHETNNFKALKQGFEAGVKWALEELEAKDK